MMKSTIWITIKPCKFDQRSILLKVEDVDNQPTLCRAPFQSMLIGEICLHDDVDVKKVLNKVMLKTNGTFTTMLKL
jgi:hypothetical protein